MNGSRPGKPPKPPHKAPKGDKQLGVADIFGPSNRTASEKEATEEEAAKALAGSGMQQQQQRKGNQVGLLSWLQAQAVGGPALSWGGRTPKRKCKLSDTRKAFSPFTCKRTHMYAHTRVHTLARAAQVIA